MGDPKLPDGYIGYAPHSMADVKPDSQVWNEVHAKWEKLLNLPASIQYTALCYGAKFCHPAPIVDMPVGYTKPGINEEMRTDWIVFYPDPWRWVRATDLYFRTHAALKESGYPYARPVDETGTWLQSEIGAWHEEIFGPSCHDVLDRIRQKLDEECSEFIREPSMVEFADIAICLLAYAHRRGVIIDVSTIPDAIREKFEIVKAWGVQQIERNRERGIG